MTSEITIERATSDYLAVSRNAALYGPGEYEDAEARAWDRLQLARDAATSTRERADATSENASGGSPGPHNPVSTT